MDLVDTDAIVEVLSSIVKRITVLINSNIDSLDKTPQTKRVLKIIKSIDNFFNVFNKKEEPQKNTTPEDGKNKNSLDSLLQKK